MNFIKLQEFAAHTWDAEVLASRIAQSIKLNVHGH